MDSDQIKAIWAIADFNEVDVDIYADWRINHAKYLKEVAKVREGMLRQYLNGSYDKIDFLAEYMDKLEDCPVVRKEAEAYLIRAKHLEKHPKNSWENHQRRLIKQKLKESKLKLTLLNAPVPEGQELENILSSM